MKSLREIFRLLQERTFFFPLLSLPILFLNMAMMLRAIVALLWAAWGSVSLLRMVNRKNGRVWSLMTPEAADPIPTQPLPLEFWLCKKSNSYLFKPQWVKFSDIYSQNICNSNWCLAWWANFPLKEEFWPMWANIPFKQYWCIQIKVQEAGNFTVNFALSWCLLTFILSPWGPSGPQKSLWSTLYPFLFFPLWYDLVITRPATQTVLSLRQVSGSNSLFFPETHDLYIHDSFRSSRCSYFSLTTQSASEVHRKLAFKTKENIQTRVG